MVLHRPIECTRVIGSLGAVQQTGRGLAEPCTLLRRGTFHRVPARQKPDDRQFKVGDKIRVNLHHGKIENAVVRTVIQDDDGIKLQVDVVGLD